jgi:hypothetical protein
MFDENQGGTGFQYTYDRNYAEEAYYMGYAMLKAGGKGSYETH